MDFLLFYFFNHVYRMCPNLNSLFDIEERLGLNKKTQPELKSTIMNKNVQVNSENGITIITAYAVIEAPKATVWEVLGQPGKIEDFHPLIENSYMISEKKNGVGSKRHCDLRPMGAMDEMIKEWIEGDSFTAEVTGGKMMPPYKFMRGSIELNEFEGDTKVIFTFSYMLKFGLLGRMMDQFFIRSQFKKAPPQYVNGLKEFIESGYK